MPLIGYTGSSHKPLMRMSPMLSEFNRTHLEHAVYAVLMQLAVWVVTDSIWAGAAAGTFFFIGREHAQAEMRVPPSQSMREFRAFTKWRYWGWDSVLDFAVPLVVTVAVALLSAPLT